MSKKKIQQRNSVLEYIRNNQGNGQNYYVKKPFVDLNPTGDVSTGLISNHVYHIVLKPGSVIHVIWHEVDQRLEVLEDPGMYVESKDFQSACVEVRNKYVNR